MSKLSISELAAVKQLTRQEPTMGVVFVYEDEMTFRPWSSLKSVHVSDGGKKMTWDYYSWAVEIDGEGLNSLMPLIAAYTLDRLEAGTTLGAASITTIVETLVEEEHEEK